MNKRLEKWKVKIDGSRAKRAYEAQKKHMINSEKLHTPKLVKIEEQVKQIINNQPVIYHHYYMIFGKEIYSKVLKHNAETLANEVCLLRQKWATRGLNPASLDAIIELLASYVSCLVYLPEDIRVLWTGLNANIPSGWTRDSDYNSIFIQGVAGDSRLSFGGAHTHTQSHTHIGNPHLHNVTGVSKTPIYTSLRQMGGGQASAVTHGHVQVTSNPSTVTYQNDSTNPVQWNAQPPYMRAIVLKPDNAEQQVPQNAVTWTDNPNIASLNSQGYYVCDGAGGTPNLSDKYILGANFGGDGGGTGGALTHTHWVGNHTHVCDSHLHAYKNSGIAQPLLPLNSVVSSTVVGVFHHQVRLNSMILPNVTWTPLTLSQESSEPIYTKLLAVQNQGAPSLINSLIFIYVGNIASIPTGWVLCDGTGGTPNLTASQIKCTTNPAQIGVTGGNNDHLHTSVSHGHTHPATHNHGTTQTFYTTVASVIGLPTVITLNPVKSHNHVWTISQALPILQNDSSPTSTSDKRYSYRENVFVKYVG